MPQNLKFTEKELVKDIQEYEEPHWMKEKRLNALDLFNALPSPEFKYGITIRINLIRWPMFISRTILLTKVFLMAI